MGNGRNDQTEMDRKIVKNTHENRGARPYRISSYRLREKVKAGLIREPEVEES